MSLLRIRYYGCVGFFPGPLSSSISVCQYLPGFVTMTLQCNVKSDIMTPPGLLFAQDCFGFSGSSVLPYEFQEIFFLRNTYFIEPLLGLLVT